MIFRLRIPTVPIAQNQGKAGRWKSKDGRQGTTVRQPSKVVNYKLELEERMARAAEGMGWVWGKAPLFGKLPVSLSILAIFPCPQSDYRKNPVGRRPHVNRQNNADNLTKPIGDAGEGVLWVDDGQICELHVRKFIGAQEEAPYVEITVEEFKRETTNANKEA